MNEIPPLPNELPYDENEAERIREHGEVVFDAAFEGHGADWSPMSDGNNLAIRLDDRYYVLVFEEPYLVKGMPLVELITAYDLGAVTGILRSVTSPELSHAELAQLLYAPSDDAPEHPILINGHPYRYIGGDMGDLNFEPVKD